MQKSFLDDDKLYYTLILSYNDIINLLTTYENFSKTKKRPVLLRKTGLWGVYSGMSTLLPTIMHSSTQFAVVISNFPLFNILPS